MSTLEERVAALEAKMENRDDVAESVRELAELFRAAKGGLTVLGWIGAAVKWVGMIAGGITAIYLAWSKFRNGG